MKRVTFILLVCLLFTGCSKKIECSKSFETKTMKKSETYKIYYEDNTINKVVNNVSYDIIDENLKKNFVNLINFDKADLDSKNIKYKYSNKNNKYKMEIIYNFDEISSSVFDEIFKTNDISNYKNSLIEQGFVCK